MPNLAKKQLVVDEIKKKFSNSTATVFTDYKGLTVEKITELRNSLRKADAEFKVYKNTLSRLAYKDSGVEDANQFLTGSTAIAFSKSDPVQMAKIIADFKKENEIFEIKGGTLGEKIITQNEIIVLATLPSREVLLAKLLGSLNAPVTGFVTVLSGTLRKFVTVVSAIKDKKEQAA